MQERVQLECAQPCANKIFVVANSPYRAFQPTFADFYHSQFLNFGPVSGAGMMQIRNGKLEFLNDKSGHYLPPRILTRQVIQCLLKMGIRPDSYKLRFFAPSISDTPG